MAVGGKRKRHLFQTEMIGEVLNGITLGLDLEGQTEFVFAELERMAFQEEETTGAKAGKKSRICTE